MGGWGREWGGVGGEKGKKRRAGGSGEGGCTCASAVAGRGGHCVLRSGDVRSASCPTLWRGGGPAAPPIAAQPIYASDVLVDAAAAPSAAACFCAHPTACG